MSLEQLKKEMPIAAVDSLAAQYKIKRSKMSWPFADGKDEDTSFRARSEEQALTKDTTNKELRQRIADEYTRMGNAIGAAKYRTVATSSSFRYLPACAAGSRVSSSR